MQHSIGGDVRIDYRPHSPFACLFGQIEGFDFRALGPTPHGHESVAGIDAHGNFIPSKTLHGVRHKIISRCRPGADHDTRHPGI